jgi:hypothetical protein
MTKTTLRNLILSLTLFVVVSGAVGFFFFQLLKTTGTLEEQILALAEQDQQKEALLRLQREAQSSEIQRAELESFFLFQDDAVSDFLDIIEVAAPQQGLSLEIEDLANITADGRDWVEVFMRIEGSRSELERFIRLLDSVPFVSRLTSVSLNNSRGDIWTAHIQIQIQLLTYVE